MAFRVVSDEKTGTPNLQPVWTSRNMQVPEPPIIANGIVFSLSSGANENQVLPDGNMDEERHKKPKGNAVLYAFDALTGQELWSSGNTIKSWTHFSGLAIANGRIFVTTHDGTLWIFGIK